MVQGLVHALDVELVVFLCSRPLELEGRREHPIIDSPELGFKVDGPGVLKTPQFGRLPFMLHALEHCSGHVGVGAELFDGPPAQAVGLRPGEQVVRIGHDDGSWSASTVRAYVCVVTV